MNKFMVDILLEGLDMETRLQLLPKEQEIVKEMEQNGIILDTYIKQDTAGIFIVMMADNAEDVHTRLSALPYYPYMKIEVIALRS